MAEDHHIIRQQTLKIAVGRAAIKQKQNRELTEGEQRLLDTPLTRILADRRNIVRLPTQARHHRAHNGVKPQRVKREQLPRDIDDFAAEYGLEAALERELELIDGATT